MAEAKHTPAPWFVFSTGHCIGGPKPDRDPPTAGIAMFSMGARSQEENLANAQHAVKCVNAHDDLVEALRAFMALDKSFNTICQRHLDDMASEGQAMARAVQLARAAIAKATGSTT